LAELDSNKLDELHKIIQSSSHKIEKRKKDQLEEIEKQYKSQKLCCICFEREKNILLLQCKHVCVCSNCVTTLTMCPICRSNISSNIQIYI